MELAGEYDITIEQGSGFTLPMRYEAPEGSPVNFTGSTAKLQARPKFGSDEVLFELSSVAGSIVLGSDGSVVLSQTALLNAALNFRHAVYDLEITPPVGQPYKLIKGNVYLNLEVTR